jgi:excisionase family DNA binding protein
MSTKNSGAPSLREVEMINAQPNLVANVILAGEELPLSVREAAVFLGVSRQTVYLWVERKQIPHLRVMGRNIRFLKSDLEPFRAQFKQEVENGETKEA